MTKCLIVVKNRIDQSVKLKEKFVTEEAVTMGMTPRQLGRYSSSQEHLKLQKDKKGQMKKVRINLKLLGRA